MAQRERAIGFGPEPLPVVGPPPLSPAQAEAVGRLMLNRSPDCVKLLDSDARIVWISAPGCRLLELDDPSRLIGRPWIQLWPEPGRAAVSAAIESARRGQTGHFTGPCATLGDTLKWWDVIVTSVAPLEGPPLLLVLSRDVTELAAAIDKERALAAAAHAARAAADRATAEKDELLAVVSHELRVPLNTVLNWAVMLQADLTDPAAVTAVQRIESATTEQILLIEQLLEQHRLDGATIPAKFEPVNVQRLVSESLTLIGPQAAGRRQRLTVEAPAEDAWVNGDPRRLRQVLINILSNAVKFTPEGGAISVAVHPEPAAYRITVRDTGAGIAPDFIGRVFDRYSQEDRPGLRRSHGLGLGLHIAKRLVDLHGGTIRVDSTGPGQGAAVAILLPTLGPSLASPDTA